MNVIFARKSFHTKLVDHFRIHSGEKPYGCAECEKWFIKASGRSRHIRTYHKELSKDNNQN